LLSWVGQGCGISKSSSVVGVVRSKAYLCLGGGTQKKSLLSYRVTRDGKSFFSLVLPLLGFCGTLLKGGGEWIVAAVIIVRPFSIDELRPILYLSRVSCVGIC